MLLIKTGWLNPQPVILLRSRLQSLQHQDPLSRFLLTSLVNDHKSPLLVVSPPLLLSSPLLPVLLLQPQQEGPLLRGQTLGFCKVPRDHDLIRTF